uniref:Uncharacterized protein n=1 Tax=Parascaris univalens TaxID=6257 RepID=A0A915BUC3_PARUN
MRQANPLEGFITCRGSAFPQFFGNSAVGLNRNKMSESHRNDFFHFRNPNCMQKKARGFKSVTIPLCISCCPSDVHFVVLTFRSTNLLSTSFSSPIVAPNARVHHRYLRLLSFGASLLRITSSAVFLSLSE